MGLRSADLKDLIDHIFEVDSYASKMGEDKNIVTVSFTVTGKEVANDLSKFIEVGYDYVIDADASPGELPDRSYKVFVEIERTHRISQQIVEILGDLEKLSGFKDFRFRYHNQFKSYPATEKYLDKMIPITPRDYRINVHENRLNNYKNFFNRSYVDSIELNEDQLTIWKKYADPLNFDVVDFGDYESIKDELSESFNIMESYPEIMFLTKYLGDYNISKYGDKIVLENEDQMLVLRKKW